MALRELKFGIRFLMVLAAVSSIGSIARADFVTVGNASGQKGEKVQVTVSLTNTGTPNVASLATDIGFPTNSPFDKLANGNPDCTVNPAINKAQTSFRFRPSACTVGTDCNAIRAGVTSFDPDQAKVPIPTGLVYTCNLTIPESAEPDSTIALTVLSATATDPNNQNTNITEGSIGGMVSVVTGPTFTPTPPSPTATPTATVTPTATETSPVTSTPTATSTPTRTRTPTITNTRKPSNDEDDGCQMVAPAHNGQAGWLLLIPAAVLIWRKRSR